MNIVEINYTDLSGQIFDGYDLMGYLSKKGHNVFQVVRKKQSTNPNVIEIDYDWIVHEQIRELEHQHHVENVLFPYGRKLMNLEVVKEADILHFHILHNDFVSLLDYPMLFTGKHIVWTVHDPWIFTGGCIHPLSCEGWLGECTSCKGLSRQVYNTDSIRTSELKRIKDEIWHRISPEIVVSSHFMRSFFYTSPLTVHLKDRVHVIPFGIDLEEYQEDLFAEKKKRWFSCDKLTVGFRCADGGIKGVKYVLDALESFNLGNKIRLITVDKGRVLRTIREKYEIEELGWCDKDNMKEFWRRVDILLMPSLAESFGVMAIESMASYTPVICFEKTTIAENTNAPNCGISVEYASSTALGKALEWLIDNPDEIVKRSIKGRQLVKDRFRFEDYAASHEKLYKQVLSEQ